MGGCGDFGEHNDSNMSHSMGLKFVFTVIKNRSKQRVWLETGFLVWIFNQPTKKTTVPGSIWVEEFWFGEVKKVACFFFHGRVWRFRRS